MFRRNRAFALAGAIAVLATSAALAAPGTTSTGPSTSTKPYVLPVGDGVSIESLLTVGDGAAGNGYEMVGVPDGLGLVRPEKGRNRDFTLLMNHEIFDFQGAVRRHGRRGSFVSELRIDSGTHAVEAGQDLIDPDIRYWDYPTGTYGPTASTGGVNPRDPSDTFLAQTAEFSRFCSASITDWNQLFNHRTKNGYQGQVYFANEENGEPGRLFGVTTDGKAQQLPRAGLFSWENTLAAQNRTDTTLLVGNEDTGTGQLRAYVGTKQRTGNPFDRAGLTNGELFVLDLADEAVSTDAEFRATYGKGQPVEFGLGADEQVEWDRSSARQQVDAAAKGLTLNRIEDGNFDPRHRNDYYFVTSEGSPGVIPDEPGTPRDGGGLWRLRFDDVDRPAAGGTIELLLDGSEAPYIYKPDNITIDEKGNLLIQEDAGNNAYLPRIVAYDIDSGARGVLARFDHEVFHPDGASFLTQDEESSGIIDARDALGKGWFLFDAQAHTGFREPPPFPRVEHGQLLAMHVRKFKDVYTIDD
ncbi:MAG TPA: alkaline phosphatase PhoX [Thermoleophilaceae bacterium]|nr:alkaline phosphatase PhoX [Thermoleophilaceae bacterium]